MIYLFGDVNAEMALNVAYRLDKNPKRANFLLHSPGGELTAAFSIYDRIRTLPKSMVTATGQCASAATVILQAGRVRRATPTTQFMFHLTDFGNVEDNKKFKPHFDGVLFNVFDRVKTWDIHTALDLKIFNAKIAKKLGFIDEIWEGKNDRPGLY